MQATITVPIQLSASISRPLFDWFIPKELKAAGIQATMQSSLLIEPFEGDWEKEWFTYKPEDWARQTHKVYDDRWKAPTGAKLAFEVRSARRNKLVVGLDQYAAEVQLEGDSVWHPVTLTPADFHNAAGDTLQEWAGIKELRLGAKETLRSKNNGGEEKRPLGADWDGPKPDFRNLRWIIEQSK